jgi:hypothetical protein
MGIVFLWLEILKRVGEMKQIQIGDWVEFDNYGLRGIGFVVDELNSYPDQYAIYITKSNAKTKQRLVTVYESCVKKIEQLDVNLYELANLAIDWNDKEWFMEISNRLNQ